MANFCIKCGSELKEGASFCSKCGHGVGAVAASAPTEGNVPQQTPVAADDNYDSSNSRNNLKIYAISILCGIAVVGVAVALLAPQLFKSQETKESAHESRTAVVTKESQDAKESEPESSVDADRETGQANRQEEEQAAIDLAAAEKAYEEFLRGERFAYYTVNGGSEEYYLSNLLEGYINYAGAENVQHSYCFVNPEKSNRKLMLVQVEIPMDGCCYIVTWQDGTLYINDLFYSLDSHSSTTVNQYGLIKTYLGTPSNGCNHSLSYIDMEGKVQHISSYMYDMPFGGGLFGREALHSGEGRAILEEVEGEISDSYESSAIDVCAREIFIEEYGIDGDYYYVFELHCDDSVCKEYISLCREKGMNIVSEEEIAKMQKEQSGWLEGENLSYQTSSY